MRDTQKTWKLEDTLILTEEALQVLIDVDTSLVTFGELLRQQWKSK